MAVVGRAASLDQLPAAAELTPDVVIVGVSDPELPSACVALFGEKARMKVIGLEANSGRARLHELRIVHTDFIDVSPDDVVATIRAAARRKLEDTTQRPAP